MVRGTRNEGFRGLKAWQHAHELALAVFATVSPASSVPGWLKSQITRSAVSVPANIAEGYGRGSIGDYLHFLEIARGSLNETEYYLEFLRTSGLLSAQEVEPLATSLDETGNLLFGLIKAVSAKKNAGTWDRHSVVKEEQVPYVESVESYESLGEKVVGRS